MARNDREYQICLAIAKYIRLKYPKIIYHFDYAGLNLSKAQAGRMKAIQGDKGFPDLAIYEPKILIKDGEIKTYSGLFIELKPEKTRLIKHHDYISGIPATPHIGDQMEVLDKLRKQGYWANFACGTDEAIRMIDEYMKL